MKGVILRAWYVLQALAFHLGLTGPKLTADPVRWQMKDQNFEFAWHRDNAFRKDDKRWKENTERLFRGFDFDPDQFAGRTVIDLGAGSKLRTKYFTGSRIIAIEPMADRCRADLGWCDLDDAAAVYSLPAEQFIPELEGEADAVISVNVLDHCYDFEQIIANIHTYLKPDGVAFLSFDRHLYTKPGHPLILTESICRDVFAQHGMYVERFNTGLGWASGYDRESTCLNFWLLKI